jgi:hypothetical protein
MKFKKEKKKRKMAIGYNRKKNTNGFFETGSHYVSPGCP